jgi:hypothetical protein
MSLKIDCVGSTETHFGQKEKCKAIGAFHTSQRQSLTKHFAATRPIELAGTPIVLECSIGADVRANELENRLSG